jgi:hypothetical protein
MQADRAPDQHATPRRRTSPAVCYINLSVYIIETGAKPKRTLCASKSYYHRELQQSTERTSVALIQHSTHYKTLTREPSILDLRYFPIELSRVECHCLLILIHFRSVTVEGRHLSATTTNAHIHTCVWRKPLFQDLTRLSAMHRRQSLLLSPPTVVRVCNCHASSPSPSTTSVAEQRSIRTIFFHFFNWHNN